MNWASKRKLQYMGGLLGVFLIIFSIFLYPIIVKKPTCFDGIKNGDETGIDCGGSCSLMCKENTSDPLVTWSRAFHVVGSTYNLVAFVENQNRNAAIADIPYEFRVYDVNNRLIGRRQGSTFIPPNKQFAVFEASFDVGQAELKSVSFEFTGPFVWVKKEPTISTLPIYVDNIAMGEDKNNPSLSARIRNESIYNLPPFDVVAILYDKDGNDINASRTVKDGLASNNNSSVFFTWPEKLPSDPVTEDVLIGIDPFSVTF